jgi:hypothetical protein
MEVNSHVQVQDQVSCAPVARQRRAQVLVGAAFARPAAPACAAVKSFTTETGVEIDVQVSESGSARIILLAIDGEVFALSSNDAARLGALLTDRSRSRTD